VKGRPTPVRRRSVSDKHKVGRFLRHYDPSQLWFQLQEIVEERTYLRHGVRAREGDVIFDVGANVGVAAVFFALKCRAGLVHSFEPVAPLYELLRENVAPFPVCVPHGYGLSSAAGEVSITYYPAAAAMSGLFADPDADRAHVRTVLLNRGLSEEEAEESLDGRYEAETLTCELRTLSSVLRETGLDRVDLLKIDVERSEMEVLRGLGDEDWPLIRQVVVEVHGEDTRGQIAKELDRRGFRVVIEQEPVMRGTDVQVAYATRP
jgi:FkbM family methyltransferase